MMMQPAPQPASDRATRLRAARFRAEKLAAVRAFFAARDVLEIEAPLLSRGASHDVHIDVFSVPDPTEPASSPHRLRYLQTSPEPHLKRLLAQGFPDVYSIAKAFRPEENGARHNSEFTMVEWYRLGFRLRQMMEETVELCARVAGDAISRDADFRLYVETFRELTGLHPRTSTREQLLAHPVFAARGFAPADLPALFPAKTDALDFLMAEVVEPTFDPGRFTVVHHFPIELGMQAEPDQEEPFLAQRFEVYAGGMELANGYKELIDAREYRARFEEENRRRAAVGKPEIPLNEQFFEELGPALPACAGVAVGFDRLLMLASGARDIREVLLFPWDRA